MINIRIQMFSSQLSWVNSSGQSVAFTVFSLSHTFAHRTVSHPTVKHLCFALWLYYCSSSTHDDKCRAHTHTHWRLLPWQTSGVSSPMILILPCFALWLAPGWYYDMCIFFFFLACAWGSERDKLHKQQQENRMKGKKGAVDKHSTREVSLR